MSQNILLIDVPTLKQRTALHDNVDEKLIYPEIKAAQDIYVLPLVGTALYNKLLADVDGGTLAGNYKTLVDLYLVDMLCNYVMAELPDGINYQFTNKGVVGKTSDNTQQPSMSDMYNIVAKYRNRAEFYHERARRYLMQSVATGMFTEYINPGQGVDTVIPQRSSFTSPIYLGNDSKYDYKKGSFEERFQGNRPNCC